MVTKITYVDRVNQFIKTYSMTTKQARGDGIVVKIFVKAIGMHLKLPIDGILEGQLPRLTNKQHEVIFEGDYPKDTNMW